MRLTLLVFAVLLFCSPALATELSADEIAKKSYEHQVMDFSAATADMRMELIEDQKVIETRTVRIKSIKIKEGKELLRRSLMTFIEPGDVAGTAFLSIELPNDADDDQFLYLPALKKVLRKGGKSGKGESFMGTQFSYGDMETKDVSRATHTRMPDEKIGDADCYVVESIPKNPKDENYSRYQSWIRKSDFVALRIKLYNTKGEFQKVMLAEKTELIDGKATITQMSMLNMQNKKATRLLISNINTKAKLSPSDFAKDRMTAM